jgi:hypothetical protein
LAKVVANQTKPVAQLKDEVVADVKAKATVDNIAVLLTHVEDKLTCAEAELLADSHPLVNKKKFASGDQQLEGSKASLSSLKGKLQAIVEVLDRCGL